MISHVGSIHTRCLRLSYSAAGPHLSSYVLSFRLHCRRLLATTCSAGNKAAGGKKKVIVISGPTGAGKSRLALELAKRLNGEIISADSVQVYRGLDIGSAKPSVSERQEVPHHLIDILHPSEGMLLAGPDCDHLNEYSVGQFFEDARKATRDVLNNGRVPIVTGGTGLYLRWYIYGKPDVPKASPEIASEVDSELADLQQNGDWDAAIDLVVKAGDPRAQSLAANDWYRLRRTLEIIRSSGSPPSAFRVPYDSFRKSIDSRVTECSLDDGSSDDRIEESKSTDLDYEFNCFFLSGQRLDLYRSIDLRCEDMLLGSDGILSEAQWLLDIGLLPNSNSATRAIGYRQENVLDFITDAYNDQSGTLIVPESLSMKKDISKRETSILKGYRAKNRYECILLAEIVVPAFWIGLEELKDELLSLFINKHLANFPFNIQPLQNLSSLIKFEILSEYFESSHLYLHHHHHLSSLSKKKKEATMLRSIQASLRRSTCAAASSTHPLLRRRGYSSESAPERKVAVLGAAGGIGQPLALLMKLNPLVSSLSLYDIAGTPGVAADVSHINTRSEVVGYMGEDQLGKALEGCDLVIIPAGVPRKPGMTRDDLFNINAGIVKSLATAIAKYCPHALVNMISNPVNSTVPIAAEVFKKAGTYDEKKLFGVTMLDVVRAKTFYAGKAKVPVEGVNVPVVGGHAGITILPLFSQATPKANLSDEDIKALTKRTQDGGTEVVEAKAGKGSATLSMAYAGAIFADACLKGLNGVPDVIECSFVQSSITELPFFASKVKLGKNGVEEVLDLGPLSDYEKQGLESLMPELKSSIEKGIKFANQS
ncbi:hypothetical protein RHGRI_018355 [Rhododendron griersonianum]|uniref:malate dehydrogenase n=1 Tax=Rhododendron griersonianum TaxID=479676 RepID=A0AAV6K163_9ERIC|nr:hypothetical protein RHGRI_018355 [Rhododendron griersonianum]